MARILLALFAAGLLSAAPPKPKLVLFLVLDQYRYDYLTRYRGELKGGFDRLLKNGASFANAHDDFFPTLTAVGHAVFLTGAYPSASGIVGNDWLDRKTGKKVSSVADDAAKVVGKGGLEGASPHRLLVATVGDELKKANGGRPRVFGLSIKDRSAILMAGKKPDGAYWFDEVTGNFITSTYYRPALPDWVQAFNDSRPADPYLQGTWLNHRMADSMFFSYKAVDRSPFGNEILETFAERALTAEKLGKDDDPDVLAVSFSSTDYVGHDYGPDSPEVHDTLLRMDKTLDKLFQTVDREVGLSSVVVVLTSDHGVSPVVDWWLTAKKPGGRLPLTIISEWLQASLAQKYGPGKWVAGCYDVLCYLDRATIAAKKLDVAEVNRAAAEGLKKMPHIARTYTREQLMALAPKDETDRLVKNGFNTAESADIVFLPERNWMFTDLTTTHGTSYDYDTHVPLIFMGAGIRAGRYDARAVSNDIAPTLSEILGVPKPSGSAGRVLTEMFAK